MNSEAIFTVCCKHHYNIREIKLDVTSNGKNETFAVCLKLFEQ